MNSLVNAYRQKVPNDPRSDDELTLLFGQKNDEDGRYNAYPDFVQNYQTLTDSVPDKPPLGAEVRMGFQRGMQSLAGSAEGAGALAADYVGANSLRDYLLRKYQDNAQQESANPATVGKLEDIHGVSDAARYALGKAGELLPSVGEAVLAGGIGSLAGTAVEPGGGTVAGGAIGLEEGILGRQAAKSILKAGVSKLIKDETLAPVVESQLQDIVARKAVDQLAPETTSLLTQEAKTLAKRYGATGANLLNFYGIGAGGEYGALKQNPNVDGAKTGAAIAGLGASAGALLPSYITAKLFPGVAKSVAEGEIGKVIDEAQQQGAFGKFVGRTGKEAAKEIPLAAGGMAVMEAANIAAEHYADPSKRGQPLTDDELSRIMNAAVVGGAAGAVAAPVTAAFDPIIEQHFANVPQDRRQELSEVKGREQAGQQTAQDTVTIRTLSPEEHAFMAVAPAVPPAEPEAPEQPAPVPTPAPTTPVSPATAEPVPQPKPATSGLTPEEEAAEKAALEAEQEAPTPPAETPAVQQARAAALNASAPPPVTPEAQETRTAVESAASTTDTNPTLPQKLAGNYRKGNVTIDGLNISLENPQGSERTGVGPDGKPWSVTMPAHYGYIRGTEGSDGDHVDVLIGPKPESGPVFVVDQIDPKTGNYDESKTLLGFDTLPHALANYDASFSDGSGPQRRGAVTEMSRDQFKTWLKSGKTDKAVAYVKVLPTLESELPKAIDLVRKENKASVSLIQRRLNIGYALSKRIVEEMESRGIVGPNRGAEPREVLSEKPPTVSDTKLADPKWQVTVQSEQTMPDGKTKVPGYVQIDSLKNGENEWSQGPDKLRAQGYNIPDFSKLPSGKYTFEQAEKLLKTPAKVSETPPEPTQTKQPKEKAPWQKIYDEEVLPKWNTENNKGGKRKLSPAKREELEQDAKRIARQRGREAANLPKPTLWIRPRSDGIRDILDAIQELGGIKPPGPNAGGEYDGYKEAMVGPARLLAKSTGMEVDTLIKELQYTGEWKRIQTPDHVWDEIRKASAQRDKLRESGGGREAQTEKFWECREATPRARSGLKKIQVNDLQIGQKFRIKAPDVSHEELTVTHIDPETHAVQVKDGPKLGVQDLPEGSEIASQSG